MLSAVFVLCASAFRVGADEPNVTQTDTVTAAEPVLEKYIADVSSAVRCENYGRSFILSREEFDLTRMTGNTKILVRYKPADDPDALDENGVPAESPIQLLVRRESDGSIFAAEPRSFNEKEARYTFDELVKVCGTDDFSGFDALIVGDSGICSVKCTGLGISSVLPADVSDMTGEPPDAVTGTVTAPPDEMPDPEVIVSETSVSGVMPAESTAETSLPADEEKLRDVSSYSEQADVTAETETDDDISKTGFADDYYSDDVYDFDVYYDDDEPVRWVPKNFKSENEKSISLFITQIIAVIYALSVLVTAVIILFKKISDSK